MDDPSSHYSNDKVPHQNQLIDACLDDNVDLDNSKSDDQIPGDSDAERLNIEPSEDNVSWLVVEDSSQYADTNLSTMAINSNYHLHSDVSRIMREPGNGERPSTARRWGKRYGLVKII